MNEVLLNTVCVTLIMACIIVIVYGCVHIVREIRYRKRRSYWDE